MELTHILDYLSDSVCIFLAYSFASGSPWTELTEV